jgi:hypothetical protein
MEQMQMQRQQITKLVKATGLLVLLALPCAADQLAVCTPDFSTCSIPEDVLLDLPFAAIAGDVVLYEPDRTTVSDVFRIFNNLFDSGEGTGVGDVAFLYSSDESTPLPDPSTYSANVVSILETDPVTVYFGNGTNYLLGAPEPSSFWLLGAGLIALAGLKRKFRGSH